MFLNNWNVRAGFLHTGNLSYLCGMKKRKIQDFIAREKLLSQREKVLVGLSGGADSVALLRLLTALGYECEAAHCNFHLRGEESDGDEAFARRLCGELGVSLHVVHFDTGREARERRVSVEMAARELRYSWFERVREACGAGAVAVGHHRDDSVETLLLNLLRGTGIDGLRGIRPRNGKVVRPLLCLDRKEITDYLDGIGQSYVTDSTNLQDDGYLRNRIRLRLLPLMEEMNPSVRQTLLRTGERLDEAAVFYHQGLEAAKARVLADGGIAIAALLREPGAETLLFEILRPLGFGASRVRDVFRSLRGQPGKVFTAGGWRVARDRELLLVEEVKVPRPPVLEMRVVTRTPEFVIPLGRDMVCFDADKLRGPLSLRLRRVGDNFVPFGMKGRRKVSDYLTDRKFSLFEKERQWLLCCGEDIVWLVGERTDDRFRVDGATERVMVVKRKE